MIAPGDDGYDAARQAWNLVADQRPAAVVHAADADDVAAVVRFAAGAGLRVAPQATGHGARRARPARATRSSCARAAGRRRDRPGGAHRPRRARRQSGARSSAAAGEHGLVGLGGSSPTVGVSGYTLGGGLGWLGPRARAGGGPRHGRRARHGHRRARARRRRERARSSSGRCAAAAAPGVVTALEFELLPLATAYAGGIDVRRGARAGRARRLPGVGRDAPRGVTAMSGSSTLPPISEVIPEPLRGRRLVDITLAYAGDARRGRAARGAAARARAAGLDRLGEIPAADLCRIAGDPEDPVPGLGAHAMLRRARRRRGRRVHRRGRPGLGQPAGRGRAAPPRRRARGGARGRGRARRPGRRAGRCSWSACRRRRSWARRSPPTRPACIEALAPGAQGARSTRTSGPAGAGLRPVRRRDGRPAARGARRGSTRTGSSIAKHPVD